MDSINIIDPSYGNPTDGTGSLVSNQIKFKKESRANIENKGKLKKLNKEEVVERVEEKLENITPAEVEENKEVIRDTRDEVVDDFTNEIQEASMEEMSQEGFKKSIKEKSEYAKRLEERVQALEAKDIDAYVSTLKPVPYVRHKPLKIKPTNYATTYENGKKFSTMVEVSEDVKEEVPFTSDITVDSFQKKPEVEEGLDVEKVAQENGDVLAENINEEMNKQTTADYVEGFMPGTNEMQEVAATELEGQNEEVIEPDTTESVSDIDISTPESVKEDSSLVEDIPEKELTESDIRAEIDRIMDQMEKENSKDDSTKLINDLEQVSNSEEVVEKEEPVVQELEIDTEEKVEDPIREVPIVAPEREEESLEKEDLIDEVVEDENLHYDYSNVTEKDIENTNSIAILEEMKRAKEQKLQAKREAEEKADNEERALVVSREEAAAIRKKAEASEKAVQAKMEEFNKYIESYDADIEEANKRREKAASDRAKTDQEIAEYEASIASNENIEKELESMMQVDNEETKKRK